MIIRTRPSGRGGGWGHTAAAFAAGFAATLVLAWLCERHRLALAALPYEDGLPTGSGSLTGQAGAISLDDGSAWGNTHRFHNEQQQRQQQQQEQQQQQQQPAPVAVPNLDAVPHLMLSFGNAAYFELAHNWAKSVQAIGAPYIIAAFDQEMMDRCAGVGLTCVKVEFGQAANFRAEFEAFRAMGAIKVRFAHSLLRDHPNLQLLVVSDTDTIWLRPPWEYFEQRPAADLFMSTDCLSHEVEERWDTDHGQPRCGHIPGKNDGRAFNTGLFAVRNTAPSRTLLSAWAGMLTDPNREHMAEQFQWRVDDQLAMNGLLGEWGPLHAASEEDRHTLLVFNDTLRLQPLPVALFANGHVAFVQRIPWKVGVEPIVIHATFQRWGVAGKRARLREFGLWHMDPPEYYGQGAGAGLHLLAYQNGVLAWVEEAERQKYGGQGRRMPLMEKHWLGMSYQLAAFRDALAAARILNRTLVLPQLWCWCDFDEHTDILKRCRIMGTDYMLPFECPLDFMLAPGFLESNDIELRHAGFLQHPQVPATLRHSRAVLRIAESKQQAALLSTASTVGDSATLWPGIRSGDLRRAVQPVDSAAVLSLRGQVPGFLGGWDAGEEAAVQLFDQQFAEVSSESKWCCMTWGDEDEEYRQLSYALPPPLAGEWQPWQAPQLAVPDWCELVSDYAGNSKFTKHPQHPCAFLRNATAADLAADDSGRYNSEQINWEIAERQPIVTYL